MLHSRWFLLLALGCQAPAVSEQPVAGEQGTSRLFRKDELPLVERRVSLMGTEVSIQIQSAEREAAEAVIERALTEITRIEELMTDWRDTSEVAAINRAAGEHAVAVAPELAELLLAARALSELTHGKFDVTYAGAGKLWDFKARPPRLPALEDLLAGTRRVDYRKLEIDRAAPSAFLTDAGMRIGLGGIAKGYAVDRAMQIIAQAGFTDFAVNAGGDLAVRGKKDAGLWWVGLRHPRRAGKLAAVLPVSNLSVVTSGDYERFFELDGRRYCHIIDPQTGAPASGCQSVTILAQRTWWADAFATGVFVLGAQAGMELIEATADAEGVIIDADGRMLVSSGLRGAGQAGQRVQLR